MRSLQQPVGILVVLASFCAIPVQAQSHHESQLGGDDVKSGVRWHSLLRQSGLKLGTEHTFRIATQERTRAGLRGPFFNDWINSVKGLSGWGDGDSLLTNYVGHGLQGAVSGYLWVQNDPQGMTQEFGWNRSYWRSRLRAMGWIAIYSTQYELGPVSDASIGNVGLQPGTKGAVDLVVTPTVGMAWLVTEDLLDRYIISKIPYRWTQMLIRTGLNPARSIANTTRFQVFWHRDTLVGR